MKIVCVNEYAYIPALNRVSKDGAVVGVWTRVLSSPDRPNITDESARFLHITKGKSYEVVDIGISLVKIINDRGHEYTYPSENFKTIEEIRDSKLDQILQ